MLSNSDISFFFGIKTFINKIIGKMSCCRKTACSDKNDVHVITVGKWAIKYIKNGLTTINKLCSCTRKLAE